MAHEQSETVEREGRWVNVYGAGTPKAGQPLPRQFPWEQESYGSEREAVTAADRRSRWTDPADVQQDFRINEDRSYADQFDEILTIVGKRLEPARKDWEAKAADYEKEMRRLVLPAAQTVANIATRPLPERPTFEPSPPAPELGVRPFLQTSRQQALPALLEGLSLLATSIAGMGRGGAPAALSALTGAFNGWAEGDSERADREYRTYLLRLDDIRERNRLLQLSWDNAMRLSAGDLDRAKALFTVSDAALKIPEFGVAVAQKRMDQVGEDIDRAAGLLSTSATLALRQAMREQSAEQFQIRMKEHGEDRELKKWIAMLMAGVLGGDAPPPGMTLPGPPAPAPAPGAAPSPGAAVNPLDAIAWAGIRGGGNIPRGALPAAQRMAALRRMNQLMAEHGITPDELGAIKAEMDNSRVEANTNARFVAMYDRSLGSFDRHMEQVIEQSGKVRRDVGLKVLNRKIVEGRAQRGDVDAIDLIAITQESASEFAAIAKQNGVPDAETNATYRSILDYGLTTAQLRGLGDILRKAGEFKVAAARHATKTALDNIATLGGRIKGRERPEAPAVAPPAKKDEPVTTWTDPKTKIKYEYRDGRWQPSESK